MKSPYSIAKSIYYLAEKSEQELVLRSVLEYINKRHMNNIVPKILFHIKKIHQSKKSINTVHVVSAFDLDKKSIDKIKNLIDIPKKENLVLSSDKQYLGGVVVGYNGRTHDFSLKNRLNKLKESLIN